MLKKIDEEDYIEIDPYNLDSTTIRYLDLDELSKAELIKCIEVLLEEIGSLDFKIDNFHEFYDQ
jgi:hypothetical protein